MSEGPILHIYKYGRKTELHTDACKQGYGAILLQEAEDGKLHPVYCMSKKKTNTADEKYDSYELEQFRRLCKKKKDLITPIARWAHQLEEFDYEIEHRAGSRMKHVDALSRYPVMIDKDNKILHSNKKFRPNPTVPLSDCVSLDAEKHEQMFRSDGQSDAKQPVFRSQESWVLIYRLTERKKGWVNPAQPGVSTSDLCRESTIRYDNYLITIN
ncbi:transposon Ty3-I Gag-Pol polyprotein [Trichonephila clavipes]|nr:transposon Ty3-I Gag-Pol polyprotein [Trichonephila clavipes]